MNDRILIAYASVSGSTAEVAEAVAEVLRKSGAEADVMRARDAKDLKPYRAVILGTALRMEKPLSEAVHFARRHRAALAGRPTACFCLGLTMKADTPENRAKANTLMAPLLRELPAPFSIGYFGGKLDYRKLNPMLRYFFSLDKSGELAEGDWRDWDAIRAWAADILPRL
jgi:menaquinone-dependent protoporphyrinogen oxidase